MTSAPQIAAAVEAVLRLDKSDLRFGLSPGEAERLVRAVLSETSDGTTPRPTDPGGR